MTRSSAPFHRRLALSAAAAAFLLGFGPAGPARGEKPANLVLVTLDTVGADELGCYGNPAAATPNLDRLARQGSLVARAVAVAPVTLPSHASLLTGLYPPRHGVRDNSDFRLPPSALTLAEHLEANGYATAAAVGAYVLSADFGLSQGFQSYDEPRRAAAADEGAGAPRRTPILERSAGAVTDAALELLDGLEEPFFLWVHYFDPHVEYAPPEPFASRFRDRPYDGEIAYTDEQLGRLLDALRRREAVDETLVVVTADHGESLGEHAETTHGLFVYEATQHVPLLLRFPGRIPAATRTDRLVSGIDLAPTVLELLELPPMPGIEGVSFAAAARGRPMDGRAAVFAEAQLPQRSYGWSPLFALSDRWWKFIAAPRPELYDLRTDPGESRNLAAERPAEVADWRDRLAALRQSWPDRDAAADRRSTEDERARLRSLGYLSGGGDTAARPAEGDPTKDPKELVQIHDRLRAAGQLLSRGEDPDRARRLLDEVLAEDPKNPAALALNGTLLCSTADCNRGIEQLKSAVRRSPDVAANLRNLAVALHRTGRLEEAAKAYSRTILLNPFSVDDHFALGNVLLAMRDAAGATQAFRQALALGGADRPPLHAALGVALLAAGEVDEGRASLLRAVEDDPRLTDGWNALGNLAERQGGLAEARGLYERALATNPKHPGALFNSARIALRLGDPAAAGRAVETLLELYPAAAEGRLLKAQVHIAEGDPAAARQELERLLAEPPANPQLVAHARDLLSRLDG